MISILEMEKLRNSSIKTLAQVITKQQQNPD